MSENNTSPTLIYSQHLRCLARLLKNTAQTEVFTYLFDEYLHLLRQGYTNPGITKSMITIAENTGVYRGRVEDRLKELAELRLITVVGKVIYIQANFLFALANLLYSKASASEKKAVCTAFQNKDFEALKKLGLEEYSDAERRFSRMSGSIMPISHQNDAISAECCEISKMMQYQQNVAKSTENDAISAQLLIPHHVFEPILLVFPSKTDFLEAFYHQNDAISAKQTILDAADIIYDAKSANSASEMIEKMMILQHFWMLQYQQSDAISATVIKSKEENKKRNTQSEALVKEREGFSEDENENDEEDEEFFSGFGKPLEVVELKQFGTVKELSETSSKRRALSYPMFTVEEVDRIVSDLDYAATSPLKLFINTVWWILSDYVQESIEPDEDDEDLPEIINIEGHGFPIEDFQKEILEVAYEEVEGYMDKGCIETEDGQSISVSFTEMFPFELLGSIFKWEKKALSHDESVYEISKNGIYDVSAEKIERACQPETREEKRAAIQDSLQYMTKLYLIQNSKLPELDRLTPIEKIAAKCIATYLTPEETDSGTLRFSINKDSESISEEGSIIKNSWRTLKATIKKHGYTEQEFLSCLLNSKAPSQYEQLTIQPCMFFADGIRTLNKLHGHESVIDDLSIDDLK